MQPRECDTPRSVTIAAPGSGHSSSVVPVTTPDEARPRGKGGRRQTLAEECSWADVTRAIRRRVFEGEVVTAARVHQVTAALRASAHPRLRSMRADGYATLRQLLTVLAWSADWEVQRQRKQMLVSVPQRILAERCGRHERTIRRHLRILEEIGLLATVREGTIDEFRPSILENEGNVVPVYVLLLPLDVLRDVPGGRRILDALNDRPPAPQSPQAAPAALEGLRAPRNAPQELRTPPSPARPRRADMLRRLSVVDIDVRPPFTPLGSERHPPHAREAENAIEPLRGTEPHIGASRRGLRAAQRRPERMVTTATSSPEEEQSAFSQVNAPIERRWVAHTPATNPAERLAAADELRWRLPVLRRISARHVRHVVREHFLAGWTVLDIQHALDHRPDGAVWNHDGASGVARPADWLAYRLAAWCDESGTVGRSRSQRLALERAEARARTRRQRDEAAAARARRAAATEDSPIVAAAKSQIDAIRRRFPPRR